MRKDWGSQLQKMRNAHQQVKSLDTDGLVESTLKISGWQQFTTAFSEDNPYSGDDNNLRAEAGQRIQALQQAARREQ